MEPLFSEDIRRAIEVLLFVAGEPLPLSELAAMAGCDEQTALDILEALREFYADRGFHPVEIAGGWQFLTDEKLLPVIEQLYKPKLHNLSRAAMETLAIIAYCQPVTRGEIEEIRGVNADHIVAGLLDKGLIAEAGRRETAGKPILYGTSDKFLELLGLNSLADLPPVEQLNDISAANEAEEEREGE